MQFHIIRRADLRKMVEAGLRGDQSAGGIFIAIRRWMEKADTAIKQHGTFPACTHCRSKLHRDEVCGWGFLAPVKGGMG